ncbi:hypothetical protein AWC38_SpisGene19540 [Stylophora pistillata]|uniref:EGF-like domain-containing protein n=1 Tax=Stylophora pistillata TaxID=50429 RepID=A0A2B4RCW0_STYPI|nr:hypothetical protein AWC38_SpisGene19540 [Stylophora pistillata]
MFLGMFYDLSGVFAILTQLNAAQHASLKGSLDDALGGVLFYGNCYPYLNHKLNSTPFESRVVVAAEDCIEACTVNHRCRSINLKAVPEENMTFSCHLLDTDKFNSTILFAASLDFHHYSFVAPCEHNPCKNGGTCVPDHQKYEYKCACVRIVKGNHCDEFYKSCAELRDVGVSESGIYTIQDQHNGSVFYVYCDQEHWEGVYKSCAELRDVGVSESGIYTIQDQHNGSVFYVYCDQEHREGGWTMVFKAVSGIGSDVYHLWSASDALFEKQIESLNLNSSFKNHYKNRLVNKWQTFGPKKKMLVSQMSLWCTFAEMLTTIGSSDMRKSWCRRCPCGVHSLRQQQIQLLSLVREKRGLSSLQLSVPHQTLMTKKADGWDTIRGDKLLGSWTFVVMNLHPLSWTMVFKVVAGVEADISLLWSSTDTLNENKTELLNTTSTPKENYKNRLVREWQTLGLKEARVVLYQNNSEVLSITFNATGTNNINWFAMNQVIESPWTELASEPRNIFSNVGRNDSDGRTFHINRNYGGCNNDAGWLLVTEGKPCEYDGKFSPIVIYYSKFDNYTNWNSQGDMTVIPHFLTYTTVIFIYTLA